LTGKFRSRLLNIETIIGVPFKMMCMVFFNHLFCQYFSYNTGVIVCPKNVFPNIFS